MTGQSYPQPQINCDAVSGTTAVNSHNTPPQAPAPIMLQQPPSPDYEEVHRTLTFFIEANEVIELRILNAITSDKEPNPCTYAGFFDRDHISDAVAELRRVRKASGCYFTPNPVDPALLPRIANHLDKATRTRLTQNSDIPKRKWLLIDFDPVRPAGISSTDNEHHASKIKAEEVKCYLKDKGWADPVLANSGNGWHLLYPIDLPTQDNGLVKRVLSALAKKFNDPMTKIDTSVENSARIWKLYGTVAGKGDSTIERPHRVSRLVEIPTTRNCVPLDLMESLVKTAAAAGATSIASPPRKKKSCHTKSNVDIDAWIEKHNLIERYGLEKQWRDYSLDDNTTAQIRAFDVCPWNNEHNNRSAFIIKMPTGCIMARCHHESCSKNNWDALRDCIEPDWRTEDQTLTNAEGTPADIVLKVFLDAEVPLYRAEDNNTLARILKDSREQLIPIESKAFEAWLSFLSYQKTGLVPMKNALSAATTVIKGMASDNGQIVPNNVRIAEHNGNVVIDLGGSNKNVIIVDSEGWSLEASPVLFCQPNGTKALPIPESGGSVEEWRKITNVPDDQWPLFITTVLFSLYPKHSHPILQIQGEQGSAKSTLCKMVGQLIDPREAPLRSLAKDERELFIAARNSWLLLFDNLSSVTSKMSDALCRIATGCGFSSRKLYTDGEEASFYCLRPVVINGIAENGSRSDLIDRIVTINLPSIQEGQRKTESEIERAFLEIRPRVLGALLDALAATLKALPETHVANMPRMADFARFGVAAEAPLGLDKGSFMAAYKKSREIGDEIAIECNPAAQSLLAFMDREPGKNWSGVSKKLLDSLESREGYTLNGTRRKPENWPASSRDLMNALRRAIPNLRKFNVEIEFGKHTRNGKMITIHAKGPDNAEQAQNTLPLGGRPLSAEYPQWRRNGFTENRAGSGTGVLIAPTVTHPASEYLHVQPA